jgi:cytoskeleton protein RodZ
METVETSTTEPAAPRSPGAILAAERERQGLARADVAQRLHMSASQIEALEQADYARLPGGPFLRGFTRNYARLLGLDSQALVAMLAEGAPHETAPRIVVPSQNIRFDPLGDRFSGPYVRAAAVATVLLVLGFAALYWWFYVRPNMPVATTVVRRAAVQPAMPPEVTQSAPVPSIEPPKGETTIEAKAPEVRVQEPAPEPAEVPALAASPAPGPASVTATAAAPDPAPTPPRDAKPAKPLEAKKAPVPDSPANKPEAPATPAVVAAGEAVQSIPGGALLRLRFKGAAWVEIKDARGRLLVSRTHTPGTDAEFAGKPPFNVVIGNAPDVTLLYNDREVDLAPHTRVAVARLTLP